MNWTRLANSWWWIVGSTLVPTLLTLVGAWWLANKLGAQHDEIVHLQDELGKCEGRR